MARIAILLAIILLLPSCSFISEDDGMHEKAIHPDIIMENSTYTLGQSGQNPVYINSSRITLYSKDDLAIVENMSFRSYDDEGNIAIEGEAGHGEINTATKVLKLSEGVSLKASNGDMMIEADNLIFDSENEEIQADGNVRVSSEDGVFTGTGFKGDLREEAYSFAAITEGIFEL